VVSSSTTLPSDDAAATAGLVVAADFAPPDGSAPTPPDTMARPATAANTIVGLIIPVLLVAAAFEPPSYQF
jgi:hypothetical protein